MNENGVFIWMIWSSFLKKFWSKVVRPYAVTVEYRKSTVEDESKIRNMQLAYKYKCIYNSDI